MADDSKTDSDPNTIAVALNYEKETDPAPVVSATGRGEVAEQILQIAFENGVRVREDADLAQILSQVDVDSPIPLEAFAAVSEIMSYLYRAQGIDPTPPEFEVQDTNSLDE